MNVSSHLNKRSSERNISSLSYSIIYLFGSKLDKRDGLQLDIHTYKELHDIGSHALNELQ